MTSNGGRLDPIARIQHAWDGWLRRRERQHDAEATERLLPDLIAALPQDPRHARTIQWPVRVSAGGTAIVTLEDAGRVPLLVKVGRVGSVNLKRQARTLAALGVTPDEDVRAILPTPIAGGVHERRPFAVETLLQGRSAALLAPGEQLAILPAAARAIGRLHSVSLQEVVISARFVRRWTGGSIDALEAHVPDAGARDRLRRLRDDLADRLPGQPACLSWVHGDYWLGNVLVDAHGVVTGIVDWDSASAKRPAALDLLHLVATTRRRRLRQRWGHVVADLAAGGPSEPSEATVLRAAMRSLPDTPPELVWRLYWIVTAALSLRRHPEIVRREGWLDANVLDPLHRLR